VAAKAGRSVRQRLVGWLVGVVDDFPDLVVEAGVFSGYMIWDGWLGWLGKGDDGWMDGLVGGGEAGKMDDDIFLLSFCLLISVCLSVCLVD